MRDECFSQSDRNGCKVRKAYIVIQKRELRS